MKQFYETYKDFPNLSALLRELSWTLNLAILSKCNPKATSQKVYRKIQ